MDAEQILAIPEGRPDRLFKDAGNIDVTYKNLAKAWHPDRTRHSKAGDVLAHINVLHAAAKKAASQGTLGKGHVLTVVKPKGEVHYEYRAAFPYFDLGEIYICDGRIIIATKRENDDLVKQALQLIKNFKFGDKKMEDAMGRALPLRQNVHSVANKDRTYTIIKLPGQYVRLVDLIDVKGSIPPNHVAWMVSRMYNLACYFQWANVRHLSFNVESFFVEPSSHLGGLYAGWFFAGDKTSAPKAAPSVLAQATLDVKTAESNRLHLAQIKVAGRKLLGAKSLMHLKADKTIPAPMKHWFTTAAGTDPVKEYAAWHKMLESVYGPRKFTVYPVSFSDIYKES